MKRETLVNAPLVIRYKFRERVAAAREISNAVRINRAQTPA